jgi:hypothetical protein
MLSVTIKGVLLSIGVVNFQNSWDFCCLTPGPTSGVCWHSWLVQKEFLSSLNRGDISNPTQAPKIDIVSKGCEMV